MTYTPTGGPSSMHKLPRVSILCYFYFILFYFFSYYELFKEFVRETQYNLCTGLIRDVAFFISSTRHTSYSLTHLLPYCRLLLLLVEQLCSGLIVLTVARNTYFMEACFDIYIKNSDPDKQVML